MTTEFTHFNLQPNLLQAVVECGYQTPTPIQAAMIPEMITGEDVIGQAQTGTGKTAAFALPILNNLVPNGSVQALILAPTRELALQVSDSFQEYGRHLGVRVLAVYGGQSYGPQIGQLRRGVDIVVGTPGRLIDLLDRGVLDLSKVQTVVLDEADEMLSMGFIEDIEKLLSATPAERQTALFSATMPAEIRRLADRYMHSPRSITVQREQMTVGAIEQRCYIVPNQDKTAALTRLFEYEEIHSALIFVRTRLETGELANELTVRGYPAEALSGDLSQDARERTLARFRQNQIKVLVATDVAARGLDIEDISHVFNYGLPDDPEIYVHRIGRTGRAGKSGVAITLLAPQEKRRLGQVESFTRRKIERATLPTPEDIFKQREQKLVDKLAMWLQRGRCQRERELIQQLVDAGHDPLAVAAAALKMARGEEKQRPIAPVGEVVESYAAREPRGVIRSGRRSLGSSSHEPGMVRLALNKGRQHGVRVNDIVGAIASKADIPGKRLGKIFIEDKHSLVDVPEELASKVLALAGGVYIRQQVVDVKVA